jgi:serine/threonine protein kinase
MIRAIWLAEGRDDCGGPPMDFGTLPVSIVLFVNRVCDKFDSAWRDGGRPQIEDYLRDASEPGRSALLRALLASELETRRQRGEQPKPEDYLGRFPADFELIRSAFGEAAPGTGIGPPQAPVALWDGSISREASPPSTGTGGYVGNWIWAWPLITAAILAVAGIWARATIERVMRDQVASKLLALRDADVEALKLLFGAHQAIASIAASEPRVRVLARNLLNHRDRDTAALLRLSEQAELRAELGPWLGQYEYDGFRILDREGHSIGSWRDVTVGGPAGQEEIECLAAVFAGHATVSRPRPSEVMLLDPTDGKERLGLPTMFVLAPIRGDDNQVIAALGFRMRPERTFTRVLNVARFGRSGETIAFDRTGLLLSESRFDDDLKRIGLIADAPYVRSTLSLELRDPGVDMTIGARPAQRRGKQPLTRLVIEANEGRDGVDVDGDRDYRGVPVIGAWTWMPEYGFGVVTKVDRAEAYRPLAILQNAFWSLFALLAAAAMAVFIVTMLLARLERRVRAAALVVNRLGRYTLDGMIGEGGMGVVYRAHHVMLRRPTAVKLLRPEKTNEKTIARFEREVQLTSQLTHPNTITVYDYGRTPEGIFYYAMEYLDGIDLQTLVARHGPQPEGRVIHILVQVCGSLVEAHGIGLIHRDIKPSNIILTRRGGLLDFANLVDFGLVKVVDAGQAASITGSGLIVGTPQYMAPEAIQQPDQADGRSDLYAVGAVGYFLLTGRPLFEGGGIAEVLYQQVNTEPKPLSADREHAVSPELESLLHGCLAKEPADRPESAFALAEALGRITAGTWSTSEADAWWQTHTASRSIPASATPLTTPASHGALFGADSTAVLSAAESPELKTARSPRDSQPSN